MRVAVRVSGEDVSGQRSELTGSHRWLLVLASALIILLLGVPLLLSNDRAGAVIGFFTLAILYLFPGYLLLDLFGKFPLGLKMLLSPVFGIASVVTAYEISNYAGMAGYFPYFAALLSIAGAVVFVLQARNSRFTTSQRPGYETMIAGGLVALSVAPVFWRSGRFSGGDFVFYGPAGQDQLYHVTLLQRLLHHMPPDNFMVSGLRPTVYHYFDDLTLALVLRTQGAFHLHATDLFDLYYRCYPTLLFFVLGALAYLAGRQLVRTVGGGVLSVLLVLGGGGLGWAFGLLQAAMHVTHPATLRASLFSHWTAWEGVDSILPLVHRPAHYHGLVFSLAAINLLLWKDRSRRDWILAGLLLGLMAGFNFTLAATFGIAAVAAGLILFLQRRREEARDLAWFSICLFVGSLPILAAMVFSGFHNLAPGFPFRGPNLEFPIGAWGAFLSRMVPAIIVPWAALLLFPVVAFGVKLLGLGQMLRLDLGEDRLRGLATVLAVVFVISLGVGTFFPYQGLGIAVVFLQPALWILSLFSLLLLCEWMERNQRNWRPFALWALLALTWVQTLVAFNFSSKADFPRDSAQALFDLRSTAMPDDVVAYFPNNLTETAVWGTNQESTNFALMAMTGLDGYFSSADYTRFSAVPGLQGRSSAEVLAQADRLYEQRHDDIELFLKGDIDSTVLERLARDRVRWVVISGDSLRDISTSMAPWRRTGQIAIYRLTQ